MRPHQVSTYMYMYHAMRDTLSRSHYHTLGVCMGLKVALSCTPRLLSRLALPICLNYLYMIQVVELEQHDEVEVPKTAFADVRTVRTLQSVVWG